MRKTTDEMFGGANGAPTDQAAKLIFAEVARQVGSEIASSAVDRLIQDQLGESLSVPPYTSLLL